MGRGVPGWPATRYVKHDSDEFEFYHDHHEIIDAHALPRRAASNLISDFRTVEKPGASVGAAPRGEDLQAERAIAIVPYARVRSMETRGGTIQELVLRRLFTRKLTEFSIWRRLPRAVKMRDRGGGGEQEPRGYRATGMRTVFAHVAVRACVRVIKKLLRYYVSRRTKLHFSNCNVKLRR